MAAASSQGAIEKISRPASVNRRALCDLARSGELVAHVPTGFSADEIGERIVS